MVVREPMNYSSEITKSLVPEHLKSLGYSELKRSYTTDNILNIEGRWYSTKATGSTNLKGKPYSIEVFLKNDYGLSSGLIIKTSLRNTPGSSDMKAFGYYDDLTLQSTPSVLVLDGELMSLEVLEALKVRASRDTFNVQVMTLDELYVFLNSSNSSGTPESVMEPLNSSCSHCQDLSKVIEDLQKLITSMECK